MPSPELSALRPSVARAVRRSRKLEDLLVVLQERGALTEVEVASELRVSLARLRAILDGRPPQHRRAHAAIPLGLVDRQATRLGAVIDLSVPGRAEVAMLRAARSRRRRV